MTLEQLEAINAVVEKGSFRAAAEALNRSQPALSTTVKNLEDELRLLIFDRSTYRPKLTAAGAAFLNVARATLTAARYAARVGVELGRNHAESELRVSVDPLISLPVLRKLVAECNKPLLPVNLILDHSIFEGSYLPLLEGQIDLALAPCPHASDKIERVALERVTLVGALARRLLGGKKRVGEATLAALPQVLVYDKRFTRDVGAGHKIMVPDHFTKLRLIEGGVAWGRISKSELGASLARVDATLCPPLELELCLLRATQRPLGPTAQAIWQTFAARV